MAADRLTPLHQAILRGDLAEVGRLAAETDLSAASPDRTASPLRFAVLAGQTRAVELLLEHGADAREGPGGATGRTLLGEAIDRAAETTVPIVDLLLRRGAEIDAVDDRGRTPLLAATIRVAGIRAFQRSLSEGADEPLPPTAFTPAGVGAEPSDLAVVELLLRRGADPNLADATGRTPLGAALGEGDEELAELLRSHGASEESDSEARLLAAVRELDLDAMSAALEAGADPDTRLGDLGPPLVWATGAGSLPAVEVLLDAGADPDLPEPGAPDSPGLTPLLAATYRGDLELVERLLAAGADARRDAERLLDYALLGRREGNHPDRPWQRVLERIRELTGLGDSRLRPGSLEEVPAAAQRVAALVSEVPALDRLSFRATRLDDTLLLESDPTAAAAGLAEATAGPAAELGWSVATTTWSLADIEPDAKAVAEDLGKVDAAAGGAWIAAEIEAWERAEAEEAERHPAEAESLLRALDSVPVPEPPPRPPAAAAEPRGHEQRLVLINRDAAVLPVLYRFGWGEAPSPREISSILAHWHDSFGARLTELSARSLTLSVERTRDQATARRAAVELGAVCPESAEFPDELLRMAASPRWLLYWG